MPAEEAAAQPVRRACGLIPFYGDEAEFVRDDLHSLFKVHSVVADHFRHSSSEKAAMGKQLARQNSSRSTSTSLAPDMLESDSEDVVMSSHWSKSVRKRRAVDGDDSENWSNNTGGNFRDLCVCTLGYALSGEPSATALPKTSSVWGRPASGDDSSNSEYDGSVEAIPRRSLMEAVRVQTIAVGFTHHARIAIHCYFGSALHSSSRRSIVHDDGHDQSGYGSFVRDEPH